MNKHLAIVGFGKNRRIADFYKTPSHATESLMKRENFDGLIWECASGDGSMSKVLEKYNDVYSSDIRTDDNVYGEKGIDFLRTNKTVSNIITNPPYRHAKKFVEHALKCATDKVAMLLKLVFCEGIGRYKMFKTTPLKKVYVFCRRIQFGSGGSPTLASAWFVWDKSYKGEPNLDWIN